jgi:putative flippase GtrA
MSQPVFDRSGGRFGRFQLISLASLALNLALSSMLARGFGVPAQAAAFAGIVTAGFTNFLANAHLTWSCWKEEDIQRPGGAVERHKRTCG